VFFFSLAFVIFASSCRASGSSWRLAVFFSPLALWSIFSLVLWGLAHGLFFSFYGDGLIHGNVELRVKMATGTKLLVLMNPNPYP
jgi:hypothetical protein